MQPSNTAGALAAAAAAQPQMQQMPQMQQPGVGLGPEGGGNAQEGAHLSNGGGYLHLVGGEDGPEAQALKRPRLIWTNTLHRWGTARGRAAGGEQAGGGRAAGGWPATCAWDGAWLQAAAGNVSRALCRVSHEGTERCPLWAKAVL